MSQLRLIRASAGSGKTYTITSAYLHLLFKNSSNFRNTLAVTFTNKATAEMKSRILSELYKLSLAKESSHKENLKAEFKLTDQELQTRARNILDAILHNYSRFSVSTIDSFFQGIIRSFAREAGIQYNFDLALDTQLVLEKAADSLMLQIEQDKTLLNWLGDFSEKRIEEGRSWDFRKSLVKLGKEIFNEQFLSFPKEFHEKIANRDFLKDFHNVLEARKITFEKAMQQSGKDAMLLLKKHGLQAFDFKYKNTGSVGSYILKLSKGEISEPTKRILEACETIENWLPKEQDIASKIRTAAQDGLWDIFTGAIKYYQEHFKIYESCRLALQQFYTLGILADLNKAIQENSANENVFVLAHSGSFLNAIIGENDTPFIYEKTGQVYKNFMIDEFQDTSGIQWDNFKPLIGDSLATGSYSMLVGDVKQSIYRWRNTDWKIMAAHVEKDMAHHGVKSENLKYNWRSKANIIAFNNSLFHHGSQLIQQFLQNEIFESSIDQNLKDFLTQLPILAYQGAAQLIPDKTPADSGYVNLQFLDDEITDFYELALEQLPKTIENLLALGNKPKDIVIIVRKSKEGRMIFDYLNAYKLQLEPGHPFRFDVLSNESDYLASSPAIQLLLKAFRYLVFPEDSLNLCAFINDYKSIFPGTPFMGIKLDEIQSGFVNYVNDEAFMSLLKQKMIPLKALPPDSLMEVFVDNFHLNQHTEFLPFIQAFHDCIAQFCSSQTPSIAAFLDYWEENQDNYSVSVSEQQDAVRIITVHKSKGLEFKNVIIPFCNWEFDHKFGLAPILWCQTSVEPFKSLHAIPVGYTAKMKETIFAPDYFSERVQFTVDNLNLLYVAFTRAENSLFVFLPKPSKIDKLSSSETLIYNTLTATHEQNLPFPSLDLKNAWNEEKKCLEIGSLTQKKEVEKTEDFIFLPLNNYPSHDVSERLRQKSLMPFFKKSEQIKEEQIFYGNFMHRLFQEIKTIDDIGTALDKLNHLGLLTLDEIPSLSKTIHELLSKEPYNHWFQADWMVMNEAGIVVPNAHQYRPDRVITKGKHAIVIDYKFGWKEKDSYLLQVKDYMECLKKMNFEHVEGYVWYVSLNKHMKIGA